MRIIPAVVVPAIIPTRFCVAEGFGEVVWRDVGSGEVVFRMN